MYLKMLPNFWVGSHRNCHNSSVIFPLKNVNAIRSSISACLHGIIFSPEMSGFYFLPAARRFYFYQMWENKGKKDICFGKKERKRELKSPS